MDLLHIHGPIFYRQVVRVGETHGVDDKDKERCFRDLNYNLDCRRHHKDFGVSARYPHEEYTGSQYTPLFSTFH